MAQKPIATFNRVPFCWINIHIYKFNPDSAPRNGESREEAWRQNASYIPLVVAIIPPPTQWNMVCLGDHT